jgi:hypothetical protein
MTEHDKHRIVFFGTPDFAINSLDALRKKFDVVAVVTAIDNLNLSCFEQELGNAFKSTIDTLTKLSKLYG